MAVIFLVELVSDSILDERLPFPWDTVLVTAVVLLVAIVASRFAFRSIDRLTAALHSRNRQLEAASASVRALHQVTVAVAALGDVDQILTAVVEHARVLLHGDVAALALLGPDGRIATKVATGPADALAHAADSDASDAATLFRPEWRQGLLAAALQHGGRTLGVLAVGSRSERAYGVDDLETIGSLAGTAAIAVEQDRVQRELRELAVRRERERIARDLHDGIAQVLGYVNTKSQAVEQLLDSGRLREARGQLAELASASRSVYVDVRGAIVDLSTEPSVDEPLPITIERLARRFADASKIAVATRFGRGLDALRIPSEASVHVASICREALTNVQKHADAARVTVHLDNDATNLRLAITDDGRGFDAAALGMGEWPHYGRAAMEKRAGLIGGTISWIAAENGPGTKVLLLVPLESLAGHVSPARRAAMAGA